MLIPAVILTVFFIGMIAAMMGADLPDSRNASTLPNAESEDSLGSRCAPMAALDGRRRPLIDSRGDRDPPAAGVCAGRRSGTARPGTRSCRFCTPKTTSSSITKWSAVLQKLGGPGSTPHRSGGRQHDRAQFVSRHLRQRVGERLFRTMIGSGAPPKRTSSTALTPARGSPRVPTTSSITTP